MNIHDDWEIPMGVQIQRSDENAWTMARALVASKRRDEMTRQEVAQSIAHGARVLHDAADQFAQVRNDESKKGGYIS